MHQTKIRQLALFFTLFVLCGCNVTQDVETIHKFTFQENINIAYQSNNASTCSYVLNVDGINIQKSSIDESKNTIYVSNFEVACGVVNTDKLGETTLSYTIGTSEYKTTATIKDLTPPVIRLKKQLLEVEQGATITPLNEVEVSDNVSPKEEIKVTTGTVDTTRVGTQTIIVTAIDKAENKATATIEVVVKAKPKQEEQVVVEQPKTQTAPSTEAVQPSETVANPNKSSPYTKIYLFKDGYNMLTAPAACQQDLKIAFQNGNSGVCSNEVDANGKPTGQKLSVQ